MSDQDDLTIAVRIGTRNTMNTSTPRIGPWTYHHVLPVRLYFMAAWTMLRVAKHRDCWSSTHLACRDALKSMCQYQKNAQDISIYLDKKRDNPSDDELTQYAKLCASPPAGGFGGPNPGQRLNDPLDQPEGLKPVSVSSNWYHAIAQAGYALRDGYGLHALPPPNTHASATRQISEWCLMAEGIAGSFKAISDIGTQRFDPTDWVMADGRPWTMLRGQTVGTQPNVSLRLRQRHEPVTYRDIDAPATFPANIRYTQRFEDYIKVAP